MSINIINAKKFIQKKQEIKKKEIHKRFEAAWQDFNKIASMIIKKYKPKRIYQWGSLLDEDRFSYISDIDIAVEGIGSAEEYFAMLGDAMDLTNFSVDLVEIEKIEPLHANSIKEKGKVVYERE